MIILIVFSMAVGACLIVSSYLKAKKDYKMQNEITDLSHIERD